MQHRQRLSYRKLSHQCCTYSVHGHPLQQTETFPVLYWGEEKTHRFSCRMLGCNADFPMCMCSWKQEHAELYFQCRSSITHAVFPFDFLCCKQGPHSRFSQNWFYRAHVHFFLSKKTHTQSFSNRALGLPCWSRAVFFQLLFDFFLSLSLFFFSLPPPILVTMFFCQLCFFVNHPPLSFFSSLYCFVQLSDADKLHYI